MREVRSAVRSVSCFVRERSVIGELWMAKLPDVRGRSRKQMLTERTAGKRSKYRITYVGKERSHICEHRI